MTGRKQYNLPYISTIILIIIYLLFLAFNFYTTVRLSPDLSASTLFWIYYRSVIHLLIIIVEAWLYWRLRKFIFRKLWANLHLVFLYVALVLIPITYTTYLILAEDDADAVLFSEIRFFLYWSLVIMAHIFFIILAVKSFLLKKTGKEPANTDDLFAGLVD